MDLVYKLSSKYKYDLKYVHNLIFKPYDEKAIYDIINQRFIFNLKRLENN